MLSDDLLENALAYASLGYEVFPCVPGTKVPLTENGFKNATTDAAQIETWWTENPHANIGLPTDGLVVIDVDGSENAWMDGDVRRIDLWRGPVSHTPRGGLHHIFRQPDGRTWRNTASEISDKVDTRANGGYILVAPSIVKGAPYTWHNDHTLYIQREQIPEPPPWLVELLDSLDNPKEQKKVVAGNIISSGQRNGSLASLAGSMRHFGFTKSEIQVALRQVNIDRCNPPLEQREVDGIAASIAKCEPDQISMATAEHHYDQDRAADQKTLFTSAEVLSNLHPDLCAPIITGLLREGETMNVIAAPKTGKSWIVLDLAMSIATGKPWLGFPVTAGRTLLIDNELHAETFSDRFRRVATANGMSKGQISDSFCVKMIRGQLESLDAMETYFNSLPDAGYFKVIILDAFYRFLPKGMSENDNGAMAGMYNILDRMARRLRCAFVLIHHTSKGLQGDKNITDIGAGGGAQSRASDCHLTLREHETEDCITVDAVARSWPQPKSFVIRKAFPLWKRDETLDPSSMKKAKAGRPSHGVKAPATPVVAAAPMTVDDFVKAYVYPAPRKKELIIADAIDAGITKAVASQLLSRAESKGLIYTWLNKDRKPVFSTEHEPVESTGAGKRDAIIADIKLNPNSTKIIAEKHGVSDNYVRRLKREI